MLRLRLLEEDLLGSLSDELYIVHCSFFFSVYSAYFFFSFLFCTLFFKDNKHIDDADLDFAVVCFEKGSNTAKAVL